MVGIFNCITVDAEAKKISVQASNALIKLFIRTMKATATALRMTENEKQVRTGLVSNPLAAGRWPIEVFGMFLDMIFWRGMLGITIWNYQGRRL